MVDAELNIASDSPVEDIRFCNFSSTGSLNAPFWCTTDKDDVIDDLSRKFMVNRLRRHILGT